MPQAIAFIAPAVFGAGGSLALVTAAGGLTLAGAVTSIAGSLLLSKVAGAMGGRPPSVQPENVQLNVRQAVGDRLRHLGRVRAGGTVVFARARGGKLYRVIVHGHGRIDGVEEVLLDQRVVALDGAGYVDDQQYESDGHKLVGIETRLGASPSSAFGAITAIWPAWDASHRLDGLWASLLVAESVEPEEFNRVYPNREPTLTLTGRGARLRDPRTGAAAWSENAALAIADHIEHPDGFNLAGWIDDDALAMAADDCDEAIPLAAGGTEPRYRIGGSYSLAEEPGAVLRRLQAAAAADVQLMPSGKIGVHVGRWREPMVTLRRDELIEVSAWASGPDRLDRYTELPFKYVDPGLAFQLTTGDTWVDLDREEANGGEVATGPEADLSFCPSHTQGRRLAQQQIERDNPAYTIMARFRPSARRALYERFIGLDVDELPSHWWRVTSYQLSLTDGSLTLSLAAYDPPTWSSAREGQPQVLPEPDVDQSVPQPTGVAAAGTGIRTAQNGFTAWIGVAWNVRPSVALRPVLQYARAGTGTWDDWPMAATTVNSTIAPLADGQAYDVRLAWRTADDNLSPWATITGVVATADAVAPAPPTGLAVADLGGGQARVTLTTSTSPGLWKTEILRGGAIVATSFAGPGEAIAVIDPCGAGSRTWTARSRNVSGVVSATVAGPVTKTIT